MRLTVRGCSGNAAGKRNGQIGADGAFVDGLAPLPSGSARSQEKNPHEMTSQGVVSERVRDMYAQEIEACYRESGQIARGPQFLDCLKRHARSQVDALAAVLVPGCRTWRHLQNWPRRCKRPKRHGFSFATRTAPISDQLHDQATRMKLFRIAY